MLKAKTKKIDPSADVSGQPDSKKEQEEKMNKAKTKKVSSFPNVAGPADSIVETESIDKVRDILFGSNMEGFDNRFGKLEKRMIMETENIDKVRDILFGSKIKGFDSRFGKLEERLNRELDAIRQETMKRSDSLEDFVKEEVKSLVDQMKVEQSERAEADGSQEKETDKLNKKLARHEESTNSAQRETRQQNLVQTKDLRDEIQTLGKNLTTLIECESSELKHLKTDRTRLASLLTEMAVRLSEDENQWKS